MALLKTIIFDINTTWKNCIAEIFQKLQEVLMISWQARNLSKHVVKLKVTLQIAYIKYFIKLLIPDILLFPPFDVRLHPVKWNYMNRHPSNTKFHHFFLPPRAWNSYPPPAVHRLVCQVASQNWYALTFIVPTLLYLCSA